MTENYYNNNIDMTKFAAMLTALTISILAYYSIFSPMA